MSRRQPPQPGEVLDGFLLQEILHQGNMATLYRVRHPAHDLALVMKVPTMAFGSHHGYYVAFEAERMILARLQGPHVPRFIASGEVEDLPYLVMAEVTGTSLATLCQRAPMDMAELVPLAMAMATAVHQLHRQEIIHFDLKPSHMLLQPDGQVVLIDFGLARHGHLPDLVGEECREPGGTPACMAPEQALGRRCDRRSDIFALGVILYQLATGQLPFGAPASLAGIKRRLYRDPLPPCHHVPHLPPWLQEIILRCLEVQPAQRYATASLLAHDLAHPDQIPLTRRAAKRHADPLWQQAKRWLHALVLEFPVCPELDDSPVHHLLVVLDPEETGQEPSAIRAMACRLTADPWQGRLTVVTVIDPEALTAGELLPEISHDLHRQKLVELRHWMTALPLADERLRCHVLTASHPATAIVAYAQTHHVDHILLGTGGPRFASVASQVAARACCTVTMVRGYHESYRS